MSDRRFNVMLVIALMAAVAGILDRPQYAIFPALVILILGFDTLTSRPK